MADRARQVVAFIAQRAVPIIRLYLSYSSVQICVKPCHREFGAVGLLARKLVSYLERLILPKKAGFMRIEVLHLG